MKVLHVISNVSPSAGGPPEVLRGMTKAQASSGLTVHICTTNRCPFSHTSMPLRDIRSYFDSNVKVHIFPAQFDSILFSFRMAFWLIFSMPSFDVVHIHGLYRFPASFAALIARLYKTPYLIRPHGSLDPYLHKRSTLNLLFLKRVYEKIIDFPNIVSASLIHFTSLDESSICKNYNFPTPQIVVPNGLDWNRYAELPAKGWLRNKLVLNDQPIVLFLGRLHFKKGFDLLIPSFSSVLQQFPDAQLVIAGPDNYGYAKQIKSLILDYNVDQNVHFLGMLNSEEVLRAYVDSDVFVLPSYTENFGVAVIEAMACSVPVVVSDQVNIHDIVSSYDTGIVTSLLSDEIAKSLLLLLSNKEISCQLGRNGRKLVFEKYTWDKIVESLSLSYKNIASK